jgi:hypothetical protein
VRNLWLDSDIMSMMERSKGSDSSRASRHVMPALREVGLRFLLETRVSRRKRRAMKLRVVI